MHSSSVPFSIPEMRDFVPQRLRPWIVVLLVIIVQLSGGVYLAAVGDMVGSKALMQQDIMMAAYASMAGMSLTFTVMFKLKFRFWSRDSLLICLAALIVSNLICMYTDSVPLMVGICFFAGIFRMWATFVCNSTIQLWITPQRDLSVFFCYIQLLVQCCICLSGLATVNIAFFARWQYMHFFITGLLASAILLVLLVYRTDFKVRRQPLYGIDWTGALLWGVTLLCTAFVCCYGEYYDHFSSVHIRTACIAGCTALGLNIYRASWVRHPFIDNALWRFPVVWKTLALYVLADILLSPTHALEHIFTEDILRYDSLNAIDLNWMIILGSVAGCLFTWRMFAIGKRGGTDMTVIAFAAIAMYLWISYVTLDYGMDKKTLYLPLFLRSFGYVIIAIVFLTSLTAVPFRYFFQAISVQGFMSACLGGAIGEAVITRLFRFTVLKNTMLLSAGADGVNTLAQRLPVSQIVQAVGERAVMVSIKEIYGLLTIVAIACVMAGLLLKSDLKPHKPYFAGHAKARFS